MRRETTGATVSAPQEVPHVPPSRRRPRANDGKYVALKFPAEMDRSLVAKYVVEDGR